VFKVKKKVLRELFSVAAFLISLAYLYRSINFNELSIALKEANYEYLFLAILLSFLTLFFAATRWYLVLRRVQKTSFKRTIQAFVSGYYLMAILPPTVGHIVKVKLVGGDYFAALSSLAFGMTMEIVIILSFGFIFLGFTKLGLIGIALILLAFLYDKVFHKTALAFFRFWENLGAKKISEKLRDWWSRGYAGWSIARKNKSGFLLVFSISLVVIFIQILGLMLVGKAFSLEISFKQALYAFLMSVIFASLSGIPSGIGANEFGILVGIGSSTKAALTAFLYKFIFQYMYSIAGAFVFYRLLGGHHEDSTG